MRKLIFSLLLAILLAACDGTYTINQRGLSISWPEFPDTPTLIAPTSTLTPTATMTPVSGVTATVIRTLVPVPTQTEDATATQESQTTVIPGTPVVFPTNEPLPALLPVVGVLNVRSGAGTNRNVIGTLGSTDCVEVDPRVIVQANGYSWMQVHVPRYGDGTWIAAKAIGGANLVRFYSGQPCIFEVLVPLP